MGLAGHGISFFKDSEGTFEKSRLFITHTPRHADRGHVFEEVLWLTYMQEILSR